MLYLILNTNTLTVGMTIKKSNINDSYIILIECCTTNEVYRFNIERGGPLVTTISGTTNISSVDTRGALYVEVRKRSDSYSKYIDSYEIYELELK